MLDSIHGSKYSNDSSISQFEDYLAISSQNYTNLWPVPEFNEYEEFPTVYGEGLGEEAAEGTKEYKRSSSGSSEESSSSASPLGASGAESAAGAAAGASSSSALASISASQVVSTTFVALVAVTAVVLPIVENTDLSVDLDVDYSGSILAYMIELTNPAEGSQYYAVVLEDTTVISEMQIEGGYLSDTISGLNGSKEHRVEVRTGTPPLLVLASEVIPGQPVWAEWGSISSDYHSISYTVTLHGYDDVTTVVLYDAATGSAVYSTEIQGGTSSDTIGGLDDGHSYELAVASSSQTYLTAAVQTLSPSVSVDQLTSKENTIGYGVTVAGSDSLTFTLIDSDGGSPVYSAVLSEGSNSGTITDLKFDHGYVAVVSSASTIYASEYVSTEPAELEVELVSLEAEKNTIKFGVNVKGDSKVATLTVYSAGGGAVYSAELSEGSNSGTLTELEYNHEYTLTVQSGDITYLTESVTTEEAVIEVELNYLRAVSNSISYKVTVTGDGKVATLTITSADGTTVHSEDLKEGANTGTLTDLKFNQVYTLTVYSEDITYLTESVRTEQDSIAVEVGRLVPVKNTIEFEITVRGSSSIATLEIYPAGSSPAVSGVNATTADGAQAAFTMTLREGTNTGVATDLEWATDYTVTVSDGQRTYVSTTVTTEKGTQNGTASDITITYGEEKSVSVSFKETPATVAYEIQSGTSVTVDSSTGALTWVGAGETTVRATYSETDHYEAGYVDVTVTATKASQTPTANDIEFTYGEEKSVSVTGFEETPAVTYSVQSGTSVTVDSSTGALTWASAGEATVRATFAATIHYSEGYTDVTVTTYKAEPEIVAPEAMSELVYMGEDWDLVSGGESMTPGEFIYSMSESGTFTITIPTAIDAGTYAVWYKFTPTDTDRYDSVGPTLVSDSIIIEKADATIADIPAVIPETVYDGTAHALVSAGSSDNGTVKYSLTLDGEFTTAIPTGTNAGTYDVYYMVAGDSNHNDLEPAAGNKVSATIAKAGANIKSVPAAKTTLVYNTSPQALVNAGSSDDGTVKYSLTVDGEFTTSLPMGTNAGTYDVYYMVAGDSNHNDLEPAAGNKVSVTIAQATASVASITGLDLTYNTLDQNLLSVGTVTGGTIKFYTTMGEELDQESLDEIEEGEWDDTATGNEAATYYVYYRIFSDDDNYADLGPLTTSVVMAEIAPATASVDSITAVSPLKYNGDGMDLLSVGTVTGGTIMFYTTTVLVSDQQALEEISDELWNDFATETIPATYYVYYRILADDDPNYVSLEPLLDNMVPATVSKGEQQPSGNTFSFAYGLDNQLTVGGLVEGTVVTYAVKDGSDTVITVTEEGALTWVSEGEKVVTATYGEIGYYEGGTFDITVTAKAPATVDSFEVVKSEGEFNLYYSVTFNGHYEGELYIVCANEDEHHECVGPEFVSEDGSHLEGTFEEWYRLPISLIARIVIDEEPINFTLTTIESPVIALGLDDMESDGDSGLYKLHYIVTVPEGAPSSLILYYYDDQNGGDPKTVELATGVNDGYFTGLVYSIGYTIVVNESGLNDPKNDHPYAKARIR